MNKFIAQILGAILCFVLALKIVISMSPIWAGLLLVIGLAILHESISNNK